MKLQLVTVMLALLCNYGLAAPTKSAAKPPPSGNYSHASFLKQLQGLDLVDQNGHSFDAAQLQGRILLFNFVFTHCSATCPMQTKALAEVMDTLPRNIQQQVSFVSVSIDPTNDSPLKLKQFAQRFNADLPNWLFLTGNEKHIKTLTQNLLVFTPGQAPAEGQAIVHNASLWLVDANGRMLQRYRGDPPDKNRLVRELSQLAQSALSQRLNKN